MSSTAFFLRNRHAVWAFVVAIIILGFVAYREIPVRLFPDTAPPLVNVVTAWPGATASDVSQDLTEILETDFAALEGVARTSSTSQDNLSMIQIEFQYGTDVKMAAVDVQNAVSRIGEDLPGGAEQPRVMTFSTADRPIYAVGVVADDLLEARRLAEDVVAPRLQAVSGVAAIDVFGGRVPAVLIDVDPALAEAHRVALPQVAAAVQAGNLSLPAGRLRGEHRETMLRVDQRAERVEDFAEIPIPLADGGQLRLGNLAEIRRDAEQDDSWFSIDGQRAISVQVYRSEDANTVAVVEEVQQVIAELEAELPSLRFVPGEESASFTEQSVSNLLSNVWQALFLASAILFLFLGRARAALVTAFTMPLSFGLTFGVMWLLGMEFNMVTLSAVILAVGMVVDASVVVLENIIRLRDAGSSPMEAAREGTDQVIMPVLAGVATTLVVLIPLLGLPGFVGKVFGPLATTLLIAFSSSVLVALVLVPILSLRVKDGGRLEGAASRISRPFQVGVEWLRSLYLQVLSHSLRRRGLVLIVALVSFVAGLAGLRAAGMDVLPRMDGGAFTISLETPSGSSLAETVQVVQEVERLVALQPEVVLVQAQAGFEPGMKFSGGSGVMGPTQGFLSITLSPRTERARDIWTIESEVRRDIAGVPGIANMVLKEVGNTAKPTTTAPLIAQISGPDPLVLDHLGGEVEALLGGVESVVEPTRTWRRDMRRVLLSVDPREAAAFGQTPLTVAQQLGAGTEGIDAGSWVREQGAAEPVQVRFARTDDPDVDELLSWPGFVPGGDVIPLRAVADTREVIEQGLFTSEDLNPVLDVSAQVSGRPLSFVVADAEAALADLVLPEGYRVSITGENNDLIESRVSILRALAISVLAVYLLLVAQFRSWIHPVTVMMAVPLSLVGVSLALKLASQPVSMPVMVGLVLLVGTVVNNAILLIDVIRQRREEGVERREAIHEGVRSRFRPIMMTTLSTVIGMTPLAMEWALGSERFSPLATAVIGGLLASTLLTLIVIPVLYDVADGLRLPSGWTRAAGVVATGAALLLGVLALPTSASAQALTLEEAWELTLEHPAALSAELQVDAASARAHAATGRLFPQVELQARATRLSYVEPPLIEIPLVMPDGSTPDPIQLGESIEEQYAMNLAVTQPIFAGGALLQSRKAARAATAAAEAGEDGALASLWLGLVQAWYGRAVAADMVESQARVLESARTREASLERLLAEGRATELSLSAVALKRAEAEQNLAAAQSAADVAEKGLAAMLGVSVSPSLADVDVVETARALAGRAAPEGRSAALQEAEAMATAAAAKASATTGALLPSVALRFGAEYSNPNSRYFPLESEWRESWDASVVLSWTLDGVRWPEASGARMDAAAARSGLEALQRQTEVALAEARAPLASADLQLSVAAERVRVAERAVQAAETALSQGRTTNVELLARESDLAMARAAEQRVALQLIVAAETANALAGGFGPR